MNFYEYYKFYNVKSDNYKNKKIPVSLENLNISNKFNFFTSLFSLYLSRIDNTTGCLVKTFISSESSHTILKISCPEDISFENYLESVDEEYNQAVNDLKSNCQEMDLLPSYYIYDFTDYEKTDICNEKGSALTLNIYEDYLDLVYNSDLFSDIYIQHMVKNIAYLINNILNNPKQILSEINILCDDEKLLISRFNKGKSIDVDITKTLSVAFRENALRNPDVIAIDDGINQVTFGELEKSSNSIAYDLRENFNIGWGSHVALMLRRDYHFPELVLALNKIGATFIPLDPIYPPKRIEYMMEVSEVEHIITLTDFADNYDFKCNVIYLEHLNSALDVDVDLETRDFLLTIMFTSGTSGLPKGVMFKNFSNDYFACAFKEVFNYSPAEDIMGLYLSFTFVASFAMYGTLIYGGTCRIFNEKEQKDSLLLIKELEKNHLNKLILPPSLGINIYENEDIKLDYLVLTGAKLNQLSKKQSHTKIGNLYGTTEIVFGATKVYDFENDDNKLPIGKPTPNSWVYILDKYGNQMPVGVPGEICVSNNFLSPCYVNNSHSTSQAFVENPHCDCEENRKMYRTGDIGFYNFEGEIEIIGREDDQLSVRGFRVESEEILSIMNKFKEIDDIYLDVDHDSLIAYYSTNESLEIETVKNALKNELPTYMVPSLFVELDEIPLNPNGKLDKRTLKNILKQDTDTYIDDEILSIVVDSFKEVLNQDVVLINDDFIKLGGNSLSAMKLQMLLKEHLGVNLFSGDIIDLSTPIAIADHIKYNLKVHNALEVNYTFDELCPLSESQLNVYLDESVNEMGTAYNNPFKIELNNDYSVDEIKNAINALFNVFPVLKARVLNDGNNGLSFKFDAQPEIRDGTAKDSSSFVRPFVLNESLCRFLIVENSWLYLDFHHLIFDGTSLNIMLKHLMSILEREDDGFEDDGVLRQISFEESLSQEYIDEAHEFFDMMLVDREEVYELLPCVNNNKTEFEFIDTFDINDERLNLFLQDNNITHNQFFTSIFAYTLSRFTGSSKVLFNLIENGRGHIDLSESVGMFVRTLPLLLNCENQDIKHFLKSSAELINSVMRYDLYPFRLLAKEYDLNSNILFQYSHDLFYNAINKDEFGYRVHELKHDLNGDMSFFIFDYSEDKMGIRILYSNKFSKNLISHFVETYKTILKEILVADKLSDINYTSNEDIELLDRYNDTEHPLDYEDILDAFNNNLAKNPENPLVSCNKVYTYEEGAFISKRISDRLTELDVKPQDYVAFLVERSELYMFSTLAVLSLGAVFVPLDDSLPDNRIQFMVEDTGANVVIASDNTFNRTNRLFEDSTVLNISDILKEEFESIKQLDTIDGDIASVLYTSGSTGIPKGVEITRKAILNVAAEYSDTYGLTCDDVYALYPSIGFDAGCESIFKAIYAGACLYVVPEEIRHNMIKLNEQFIAQNVTHTIITTQVGKLFMEYVKDTSLKYLFVGGEKLGEFESSDNYILVDEYGLTETNNFITSINNSEKIDPSSIGHLNYNSKAYILDSEGRRIPYGAVGELYLAGYQVSRGYLNRPEETSQAFLNNPFDNKSDYNTMYRTGDMVRMLPDGTLSIVGRSDGQVKIRGNRVELSEVESTIRNIDFVSDVTVQTIENGSNNELVAYVVLNQQLDDNIENSIRNYVAEHKPDYMVPSFVIIIDRIPLNVNDKVDKNALPEVDFNKLNVEYVAPTSNEEKLIAEAFEKVFNKKIGIYDDFIRLGGDSLTAIKILSYLNDHNLTAADILSLRTPHAIAENIKDHSLDLDDYSLDEGCPLNESQLNVYLDIMANDKKDSYIIPLCVNIPEMYDVADVEAALNKILDVHPILEMCVSDDFDVPYLVKQSKPEILVESERNDDCILEFIGKPFDLHDSLSRFLIINDNNSCSLFGVFHHIIFDALSEEVFKRDLLSLLKGNELDVDDSFLKTSAFHQQIKTTRDYEDAKEFYNTLLSDVDETNSILESPLSEGNGFCQIDLDIDSGLLKSFLKKHNISENVIFISAFAYTLSRYVSGDKALFNIIDNGRERFNNFNSIGMFVTTLPMVVDCKNQDISSFMEYIAESVYEVLRYNYYPFRLLANEYDVNSDIIFQYVPEWILDSDRFDDEDENDFYRNKNDLIADLLVEIIQKDQDYDLRVTYCDKYCDDFIDHFIESYKSILHGMLNVDELSEINYISNDDIELLDSYNDTEHDIAYDDVLDAFNDNLSKYCDNALVSYNDNVYSYGEGAYIANNIAQKLIELGVKSQDSVSFLVERSELYMFCVLGILSTGAVYVPLDDNLPNERLEFIINDTASRVIIVSDETYERAQSLDSDSVFLNLSNIVNGDISSLNCLPTEYGNLACILYTSGTTGIPKGVKITRKSLINVSFDYMDKYDLTSSDVFGLFSSIGFDVSSFIIFSVILSAACLSVVPEEIRLDMHRLNNYFISQGVTHGFITTHVGKLFVQSIEDTSLNVLIVAGEKLGEIASPERYELIDAFGPTEAFAFISSINNRCKIDHSSIGYLNYNTKAYVLDNEFRRVPIGAVGELYLSGAQIADGYLNLEDESKESFLDNPFDENEDFTVMYRTGDMVRVLPDGSLGIVGRRDSQVKIRGNRVELSEVESAIREIDFVNDVTVQTIDNNSNNELVAYVVVNQQLDNKELKNIISKHIIDHKPDYMVPSFVIKLDSIPLKVNGKVDKHALPEVDIDSLRATYVAPTNKKEKEICNAFEVVFNQNNISLFDDFIRLGGDSIAAIRVISLLRENDIKCTARDILNYKTPYLIAQNVTEETEKISYDAVEGVVDLLPIQRYFFNQVNIDNYTQEFILKIREEVDLDLLQKAFDELTNIHDMLRAVYHFNDNEPIQEIRPLNTCVCKIKEHHIENDFNESMYDFINNSAKSIDITDHLVDVNLIHHKDDSYLSIIIHHLIIDGVSWNNLLVDLTYIYSRLKSNEEIEISRPYPYKNWVNDVETLIENISDEEKQHWTEVNALLDDTNIKGASRRFIFNIKAEYDIDNLLMLSEEEYWALAIARAYKKTYGKDIIFNRESYGRDEDLADVSRTIGWFTSQYPVPVKVDNKKDNISLMKDVYSLKRAFQDVDYLGLNYGSLIYTTEELKFKYAPVTFNFLSNEFVFKNELLESVNHYLYDNKLESITRDKLNYETHGISFIVSHVDDSYVVNGNYATGTYIDDDFNEFIENIKLELIFISNFNFDDYVVCCLSEAQLGIYLDEKVNKKYTAYSTPDGFECNDYSVDEIRNAIKILIDKHPILKGRILDTEDIPILVCDSNPSIEIVHHDNYHDLIKPFNLEKSIARFFILDNKDGRGVFYDIHHICSDATSHMIINKELKDILNGDVDDDVDLGFVYASNDSYESQFKHEYKSAYEFYNNEFSDMEDVGYMLDDVDGHKGKVILPIRGVRHRVETFCHDNGVTINNFLNAIFAYTYSRFTASTSVYYTFTENGRHNDYIRDALGMFVNTIPIVINCENKPIVDFIDDVSNLVLDSMVNSIYPFRLLANEFDLTKEVLFEYNYSLNDVSNIGDGIIFSDEGSSICELLCVVNDLDDGFVISLNHLDRFSQNTAERFVNVFKEVLIQFLDKTELCDIDYISEGDIQILNRFNETEDHLMYNDVLDAFNDNLVKNPDNTLVTYCDRHYSYSEAGFIADKIAQRLIEMGVESQDCVSFLVERSELYMFCILSILSIGAIYVPLNEQLPDERLEYIINDTNSKIVIVSDESSKHANDLNGNFNLLNISDIVGGEIRSLSHLPVVYRNVACVLYTSGTTGFPKGVKITRLAVINNISWYVKQYKMCEDDIYGMHVTNAFDMHLFAIFSPMLCGASVNIIPRKIILNLDKLAEFINENNITHTFITTQLGKLFYNKFKESNLKYLVVAGEKLGEITSKQANYKLLDFYGPSESIVASYIDVNEKIDYSSVGRLVDNVNAYILDNEQRQVPVGAVGELYLSGNQLADGYLNLKDENKKAFINNPFDNNDIMYRTRDLVRILPDNTLAIVGRRDSQVKIRGNRVELTEIESVIREIEFIDDVTVQTIKKDCNDKIVAYVVMNKQLYDDDFENVICDYIGKRKPSNMIPSFIISLDSIPLRVNGKVDKRSLPEVDLDSLHAEYVVPTNNEEKIIVEAFEKVLHQNKIGIYDDFIRLGGDSLMAINLLTHIGDNNITASDILSLRTPKAIAENIKSNSIDLDIYSLDSGCPLNEPQLNVYLDIWANDKKETYIIPLFLDIPEKYGVDDVASALDAMLDAHPILSMCVSDEFDVPYLVKGSKPEILIESEISNDFIFEFATKQFDLSDCLCRFLLMSDENDNCSLFAVFHHIIFDVSSERVFKQDLLSILEGNNLEAEDSFLEVSAFNQQITTTTDYENVKKFYDSMLVDIDEVSPLLKSVESKGKGYSRIGLDIDNEAFKQFLYKYNVNENVVFTSVFAYCLSRYSGSDKVLFNIIENGRARFRNFNSIGMYANTLPMLVDCKNQNMTSFMEYMKNLVYNVMRNNYYPYRLLANEYNLDSNILFQFIPEWIKDNDWKSKYDKFINYVQLGEDFHILEYRNDLISDLIVEVTQNDNYYNLEVIYSEKYSKEFIQHFIESYKMILHDIIEVNYLSEICFISDDDIKLLERYNQTEHPMTYNDILDGFNDNLARHPDNILVSYEDASYTYSECAFIGDKIANRLKDIGIKSQDNVAYLVERSEWYLLVALGILSVGAVYVPLDDDLPDEHLKFIIKDSTAKAIVVSDETYERAKELSSEITIVNVNEIIGNNDGTLNALDIDYSNLACILYTSGTTGVPKGVKITRLAVINQISWYVNKYKMCEDDIYGMHVANGFDMHLLAIFSPMICGASVNIIPRNVRLDLDKLAKFINDNKITHTFITTQLGKLFYNKFKESNLKYLVVGGEKLGEITSKQVNYKFIDFYGPSESIAVSYIEVDEKIDYSSIGQLVDNVNAYILDNEQRQVPVGAVGELYLSGNQLADGYLNLKDENKKAFINNPFDNNSLMYRTGDLVRVLPDNTLAIVGRRDSQVKIRGNRIELSEIENTISKLDIIDDVTVQSVKINDEGELIAYVVLSENVYGDLKNIICDYVMERKPPYMIPSYVIQLDKIPLNVNGKVDKNSLPNPEVKGEYVEPVGYTEEKLLDICHEIVDNYDFGVTTNLYNVGFTSLNMILLTSKIYDEFEKEINLGVIFNRLTVRGIADEINQVACDMADFKSYDYYPLTSNQMRMFKEVQLTPGERVFHVPYMIEMNFTDEIRLKNSLIKLVNLHDSLRLILSYQNETVMQKVSDALDLDELITIEYIDELNDEIIDRNTKAFNLIEEPLFNFSICKTKEKMYLFFVMHHIITDAISINIMLNNLYQIYLNHPEKIIYEDLTFPEYVLLESDAESENNKYIQQYYSEVLDEFTLVSLPGDKNDDYNQTYYDTADFKMNKEKIYEFCKKFNITPYDIFLLSTMLTLNRYLKNNKLMFFTVFNGRNYYKLLNTVGCLAKSLIFSLDNTDTDKSLKQCFNEIHDITSNLVRHEPNSFIYDYSRIENEFEFNYVSLENSEVFEDNNLRMYSCPKSSIRDNTIFYVVENQHTFDLQILYKSNIYSCEYISKFLNDIVKVIEKIIDVDDDINIHNLIHFI